MNRSVLRGSCLLFFVLACFLLPATALAQPVFKAIDQSSEEDEDRIYLDTPDSASVGDFMLVQIALSDREDVTDIPAGWTELLDDDSPGLRLWVGYKFVTQDDIGDSFRWEFDAYADIVGQLRLYGNVDPENPIDDWDYDDNDYGDVDSSSVTTTLDNTLIVRMFAVTGRDQPDDIWPAHDNEYFEDACECVDDGVIQGSADLPQPLAGGSGSASWDMDSEGEWRWFSVTVALAEDPSRDITGIPVLNRYSLAIMALLMLGLGMVGFRRFI